MITTQNRLEFFDRLVKSGEEFAIAIDSIVLWLTYNEKELPCCNFCINSFSNDFYSVKEVIKNLDIYNQVKEALEHNLIEIYDLDYNRKESFFGTLSEILNKLIKNENIIIKVGNPLIASFHMNNNAIVLSIEFRNREELWNKFKYKNLDIFDLYYNYEYKEYISLSTWEKFKQMFLKTPKNCIFKYGNEYIYIKYQFNSYIIYRVKHNKKFYKKKFEKQYFKSPQELTLNAKINGFFLKDIYCDFEIIQIK